MLRVLLFPVFLLLAAPAPGQKSGAIEEKEAPKDPFTDEDPEAMKALGVVSYGPLPWIKPGRTTEVDKVLGENRIVWFETAHFRIGGTLESCGPPADPKARKQLNDEMKELHDRCSKFPARASKLTRWMRLHLYALRAEQLYERFGKLIAQPGEAGDAVPQPKEKLLLLLFQKRSDLARYLDRFCDTKSEQSQRYYHYDSSQFSLVMTAEHDEGVRAENELNTSFRFLMTQVLCDATGGVPQWVAYGLGHVWEREVPCNFINCPIRADESVDPQTQNQWERKMKKRAQYAELVVPFDQIATLSDFGYYAHLEAWSRVDFLLASGEEKFGSFVRELLGQPSRDRQAAALQTIYDLTPEAFDAEWRKWAQKTYK